MSSSNFEVRRAAEADLREMGQMAGALVRQHHAKNPDRFLLVDRVEEGYASWFHRELARAAARLFVAERGGELVGYAYGTLEGRDWNLLLDAHGAVHDIFVVESARRDGVGKALLDALVSELERMGAPRILLSTMVDNHAAQRLFASAGFLPTMLEMTRVGSTTPPARR